MKENMMIIGAEILDNDVMELTLTPLTIVKKKPINLMDLAGGNIEQVLREVQGVKTYKTKIFMKIETWGSLKLKIGDHVSIELEVM